MVNSLGRAKPPGPGMDRKRPLLQWEGCYRMLLLRHELVWAGHRVQWLISLLYSQHDRWVLFPKFSVSKNYRLENFFPELGIKKVLPTQADLSGITGSKDIRVSKVRQEAQGLSLWVLNVDSEVHVGIWGCSVCEKTCMHEIPYAWEREIIV